MWNKPTLIPATSALFPWIILLNVTFATTLAIISSLTAAVASTSIAGPLMIDSTDAVWLSTGYLAAVGLCLPLSGWMGKSYGAKTTFFLGFAIFVFASLCASFAPNFAVMLIFRLIEGAGAGLIFPISLTILQVTFPKNLIVMALSIYVGCGFGAGIIAGLLLGGYIGQYMAWQWVYWINVFLGLPCLLLTFLFHQETVREKSGPAFDWIGFLFFGGFLASLLVILTNVKASWNTLGWESDFARGFIALGILCFIFLMMREMTYVNPIIRLHLFKQRHFAVGSVLLLLVGALLFGTVTTIPTLFEAQLGYQKWTTGFILAVFGFVMGPMGAIVGLLTRFINVRLLALLGLFLLASSCFVQGIMITVQSEHWQWMLVFVLRAAGVAFSLGPLTSLALVDVKPDDIPCASMIVTFCRQMGGAVGGSLLVLMGVYREEYHRQIYSSNVNMHAPAFQNYVHAFSERYSQIMGFSPDYADKLATMTVVKNVITQAEISAVNDTFYMMGWVVLAGTLVAAAIIAHVLLKAKRVS